MPDLSSPALFWDNEILSPILQKLPIRIISQHTILYRTMQQNIIPAVPGSLQNKLRHYCTECPQINPEKSPNGADAKV
jgi:hypothetical protein